ncbi:MAG: tRNA lysidine(34) synthetase TilS [Rhodanobacter sp.]|nr:MAG: tRNA lysidine(34) synthetase TilS [Rhodanobacter sp.]TAM13682.1 MAG: tRNA lysidine(34) synthetase TilS [Rhodanobacter sp.]TAM35842.1 MAG: tRNA lysidine(34) synthetase TilS [Rhodanobacter sp.]
MHDALAARPRGTLCVAFSGGPDSTALLHALAQLPQARARGLHALHVDHGLNPHSATWAEHCTQFCTGLALACTVVKVDARPRHGEGIEAAARSARYAAFAARLLPGETLLLAHHRDDQVETVLLKLLRGAGPEGLGGMRETRALGAGTLWRPLLHAIDRAQLRAYVTALQLPCIDDPANADPRFARNRLRHEILPRLVASWPGATDAIMHSAGLCRAAADALRTEWLAAFAQLHDAATGSLDAAGWLALAPALREPLLDHWLHQRGLQAPTTAQRGEIVRQCAARVGQVPCVRWAGTELHVWQGRLWAHHLAPAVDPHWHAAWHGETLALPDGGTLALAPATARLPASLSVRLRRGGEHIKPAGDAHTRELRDLFQQAGMPPWQRRTCPLIEADGELVGVADRWLSARGVSIFDTAGGVPCWMPPD